MGLGLGRRGWGLDCCGFRVYGLGTKFSRLFDACYCNAINHDMLEHRSTRVGHKQTVPSHKFPPFVFNEGTMTSSSASAARVRQFWNQHGPGM